MVRDRGIVVCTPPFPEACCSEHWCGRMCRKQMLPHDFWVFVLMMSSTRLSFNPLMEVQLDLKSDFMDGAVVSYHAHHRGLCCGFYTMGLYFFTPPCPLEVNAQPALCPIRHRLLLRQTSKFVPFTANCVHFDLLPARQPLIISVRCEN